MNRYPEEPVPEGLLSSSDAQVLSKHLARYVVETRRANGNLYPPSTLHSLMCGLLRHMRSINPECPNFLDKKDVRFQSLHKTLDALFNRLHSDGIGRQVKKADVISHDEERMLWDSGLLNT